MVFCFRTSFSRFRTYFSALSRFVPSPVPDFGCPGPSRKARKTKYWDACFLNPFFLQQAADSNSKKGFKKPASQQKFGPSCLDTALVKALMSEVIQKLKKFHDR